jgi:2-polyprenyl-3-methyl-5-hydroxy-6-metoxy-1,4-benzoquinol methylase
MNINLKNQRQRSALASGGVSNYLIYAKFLQLIEKLDLKGDCLDFGAGIGNLTKEIQTLRRFNCITAADIMERPGDIDESINWLTGDLNNSLEVPDHSFDVIVSSEVIEHLENPRAIAREWFRLLKPNGTLILSTPNNESWRSLMALLIQGHFVLFGDSSYPAHITALVRKDIERIMNESGFAKPIFTFSDSGGIPKFPQLKWQSISFGILKGLRFSDNVIAIVHKK